MNQMWIFDTNLTKTLGPAEKRTCLYAELLYYQDLTL